METKSARKAGITFRVLGLQGSLFVQLAAAVLVSIVVQCAIADDAKGNKLGSLACSSR